MPACGHVARVSLLAFAALAFAARSAEATDLERRVAEAASALREQLQAQRRDLHMHPELSNREERTARVVADKLRALGLDEVRTGVARHGVVGLLRGARPGPVVAVRADMDALPIAETIDVPYKSLTAGVKHACGHDVHTAVQLGVAEVLVGLRAELPGSIKFLFQPAEEGAPTGETGGARQMIADGALQQPKPQAIFGLHVLPALEVGQIGVHVGPAMASSDRLSIRIRGKRAHGAQPQLGVDAIVVAAECITALQSIRSRRTDPLEATVLTIGTIEGGDRSNILADEVRMAGTLRALDEKVRLELQAQIRQTLAGITSAHGASFELVFDSSSPVTYNDPALAQATVPAFSRAVGAANVLRPRPLMPAEDFAFYQQVVPGLFYFLGVGNPSRGITAGLHTAEFDVDEASLVVGVRTMATVLIDYLERAGTPPPAP